MARYSISLTIFLSLALIIVPDHIIPKTLATSRSIDDQHVDDYGPPRASHGPKRGVEINDYPPIRIGHRYGQRRS